jgi:type II secretory pathway pseudopilin PulG
MKTLRLVHVSTGIVVMGLLLLMAWGLISSQLANREQSRVETVQKLLEKKLDAYYRSKGEYPDSLQMLGLTNAPQDALVSRVTRQMTYQHTRSSYTLSYSGFSFHI